MGVQKEPSGRRSVQVDVEVAGTPEEVWQVMATGPGISCWFVPTDVEEREGGKIVFHFGPGMDAVGTILGWQPPEKLTYEERDWMPGAPPLATEIWVETRDGGRCVVRMVHSLFASDESWDGQLESFESGWPGYFRILRIYLERFRGLPCKSLQLVAPTKVPEAAVWERILQHLRLEGKSPGDHCQSAVSSGPGVAGTIESIGNVGIAREVLIRLDGPSVGLLSAGVWTLQEKPTVSVAFYRYGANAADEVAREQRAWTSWLNEQFSTNLPLDESEPTT